MPICTRCESQVSLDFARVYGDGDGTVDWCPRCRTG
ncbi:DUF7563 family protein [Halosolutus halophilus]